jgi:O-methyltransferase involved in polyketide biosynthesis
VSEAFDWQPTGIDVDTPSAARIYDYALGGAHNFAADRAAAAALFKALPEGDAWMVARANRSFLQRAVRYCCAQGIRQFLDLGSGIPTVGNVHEIAHQVDPACRVVYVDNDPVSVATTRHMLEAVPNAAVVDADMRKPEAVLGAEETRQLLDFGQPVAVMMCAVLHYVSFSDNAAAIVDRYKSALAPGSFLVVSHTTDDPRPEVAAAIKKIFDETATPITHRNREQVAEFFADLELVEPGLVWTPEWRPEDQSGPGYDYPERSATFAAVGRVPAK